MTLGLVKVDSALVEQVWKVGGLYGPAIQKVVEELQLALPYAENQQQKRVIELLIHYYHTGDLKVFDEYSILWVHETSAHVDFVNGFVEIIIITYKI
jgi:dipeptidyl-peptidase-3